MKFYEKIQITSSNKFNKDLFNYKNGLSHEYDLVTTATHIKNSQHAYLHSTVISQIII